MIQRLLYKWRRNRKVYTEKDLTEKLREYQTWLMDRTKYDFNDMRERLLTQEQQINELKAGKVPTQKSKRTQRRKSSRKGK